MGTCGEILFFEARPHDEAMSTGFSGAWFCHRGGRTFVGRPPAGRRPVTACRCEMHGGEVEAERLVATDWTMQAPASVGDEEAVLVAGTTGLTSPNSTVVLRRLDDEHHGGKWLAFLGLGSHQVAVRRDGTTARTGSRRRGGHRAPEASCTFETEGEAREVGLTTWRRRLDADVAAITAARGGTLAWGIPVGPSEAPKVLVVGPGERPW